MMLEMMMPRIFLAMAALSPPINFGGSVILSWLLTLVIIAAVVWMVVWLVTKVAGPPSIPEPIRWVIWVLVAGVLLWVLFAALGVRLP
jgi:hypothetical protein